MSEWSGADIYRGYKGALRMICDIGCNYDNMDNSVEDMKRLVDELVGIATSGLEKGEYFNGLE